MKILIIPSWYPTPSSPISGIFFKEQAEEMKSIANVAVLHILEPIKIFELTKIIRKSNSLSYQNGILTANIEYVNWIPYCNLMKQYLYQRALKVGYLKIKAEFGKPDIIHAHSTLMGGYGAIVIGDLDKIPVIVTEHVSFFNTFFESANKNLAHLVLKKATLFTAVSVSLQKKIWKKGRMHCKIIPNFISSTKFNMKPNSPKKNGTFHFLNISTQVSNKGVDILLKAFSFFLNEYQMVDVFLDIIGKGPEKEKYITLMKDLNLENNCKFHGEKSPDELELFFHQADALIIASREETFGIVGIEAMSVGIPVIATRCGGPEDYINQITGILVENANYLELAKGMNRVIEKYHTFNREAIRSHFLKNYSSEAVLNQWKTIYSDLLEGNTPIQNPEPCSSMLGGAK